MLTRLALVFVPLLFFAGCGSSSHKTKVGTMSELRKDRVAAIVDVGGAPGAPDWQAQATDAVWIANSAKQTLQRIDPSTNRKTDAPVTIQSPCAGLTVAFGSVWSADCTSGVLYRVDAKTGQKLAQIPVTAATDEGLSAATSDAVFVPAQDSLHAKTFLAKIDPATNKVVARIPLPYGAAAAASGFGAVWVSNPTDGSVVRVDSAADRVTATIKTRAGSRFLAAGEGAVWVLNQSDGSVSKIDPSSAKVVATIPANVPGEGGCIATGLGSVWVTMPATPLLRIDPKSDKITERWTGVGGDCLSTGFGSVWLSNHEFGNVWRIKP
jgi:virginiamycin B lyase